MSVRIFQIVDQYCLDKRHDISRGSTRIPLLVRPHLMGIRFHANKSRAEMKGALVALSYWPELAAVPDEGRDE